MKGFAAAAVASVVFVAAAAAQTPGTIPFNWNLNGSVDSQTAVDLNAFGAKSVLRGALSSGTTSSTPRAPSALGPIRARASSPIRRRI